VAKREQILKSVDAIQCSGSTNLIDGIRQGYALARRHFRSGQINRVILCSDGVANVGETDAEDILSKVENDRRQGISLTSVGFGLGAYDDALLETLANRGDGSYMFVGSDADGRRFADQLGGALQTIAKDAKIQVQFSSERVRRYRLVGYENRDIADKDFRNDAVDAGEVGSGQSATALYELELHDGALGEDPGDLGTVYVRYRNTDTGAVEEISTRLETARIRKHTPRTAPRLYLAAAAAEFAEILRESEHAAGGNLRDVERIVGQVSEQLPLDGRVKELQSLVRRCHGLPKAP
jgi:Ca-activated chloride channel family protein